MVITESAPAAVDDLGNILQPVLVEGQVHGGVAQGWGQMFGEHAVYDRESGQFVEHPGRHDDGQKTFLGKSGRVTELMKGMAALSVDEKKSRGAAINLAKQAIEAAQKADAIIYSIYYVDNVPMGYGGYGGPIMMNGGGEGATVGPAGVA